MNVLERPNLQAAAALYADACKASREYDALARAALKRYGAHGAQISGCLREHFPERTKQRLRDKAIAVTMLSVAAWDARPPRVRASTMRALARAVATRDGSGFYGPQA